MTNINKIITKFAAALVCAATFSGIHCADEFNTDGRRTSSDFSARNAEEVVKKSGSGVKDRSAAFEVSSPDTEVKRNFKTLTQRIEEERRKEKVQLENERKAKEKAELEKEEERIKAHSAALAASNLATQDARDAIKAEVTVALLESALQKASDDVIRLTKEYNTYSYVTCLLPAARVVYQNQQEAIVKAKQLQLELENLRKTAEEKKTIAAKSSNLLLKDWNSDLERESIRKELSEASDTSSGSNIPLAEPVKK